MLPELEELLNYYIKPYSLHTDFHSYLFLDLLYNEKLYMIRYDKTKYYFSYGDDLHKPCITVSKTLNKEEEKQLFIWLKSKIANYQTSEIVD